MNTDRYYYFEEKSREVEIPEMSNEQKFLFRTYVEKNRFFIELIELYKIFRFNLQVLLENFEIKINDTVVYKHGFFNEEELHTSINALTINFMSSGKTLLDAIDTYLKSVMGKSNFENFRAEISSNIYDESFSYRLLLQLRNYSQHGHIPVDVLKNRASFNLDDILNKPHFKINKTVKNEMSETRQKILDELNINPCISYIYTIADFNYYTIEIYFKFLCFIKEDLKRTRQEIQKVILKQPEMLIDGMVCYDFCKGALHFFNPDNNIMNLLVDIKKTVKKDLIKEKEELSRIKSGLIRKCD